MKVSKSIKSITSPPPEWKEDEVLWHHFKQGDRAAFEYMYQQYIQALIQYGYKITNNRSLIQDCIQDLFVEFWESRDTLAEVKSIKHYLLKSLRYKIIRHLQYSVTESLDEAQGVPEDERELFREETALQQSKQLADALTLLPKRQQEAIHLRYFHDLSNEEVAQVMGVNYQSACKFIYTRLKTLREKLQLSTLLPLLFSFF